MIESGVFTDEISLDFDRAVRIASELGVNKVDVRTIGDKNISEIDEIEAQEMMRVLRKYGCKVGTIASPFGKCSIDNIEEYNLHLKMLEHLIWLADFFDTQIIRSFAFWRPKELREDERTPLEGELLEKISEKLSPAVKIADESGKILALETEGSTFVGTCAEACKVLDSIDNENLKVCWDIANGWYCGEVPFPDGYSHIRGLVVHLHIKDFMLDSGDINKKKGCIIGEGIIPYDTIFRALLYDEFDGIASIETHLFFGDPDRFEKLEKATVQSIINLKEILKNLG